jgi:flagellar motor switch protein FliM
MRPHIRRVVFGARSALPTSAACVVANGVRETLASLLGVSVEVGLSEPSIPNAAAWPAIVLDAMLYRIAGAVADAVIVLRPADALALAGALFGEPEFQERRALSPIENDVIDRTIRAIAAHLGPVCGASDAHTVERIAALAAFSTYFEIFIEAPVTARVGIALSRDPAAAPQHRFDMAQLADVSLRLHATFDIGILRGSDAAALRPGMLFPISNGGLQRCALRAGNRQFARGGCGVRNGHYAVTIASS